MTPDDVRRIVREEIAAANKEAAAQTTTSLKLDGRLIAENVNPFFEARPRPSELDQS